MADFTYTADHVLDETINANTLVSQFENGAEQRRQKWSNNRRQFKLLFRNRISTEMEAVRDFFISKKGKFTSFTWDRPATDTEVATEYDVRFDEDSFVVSQNRFNNFDFDLTLIEVL